MLDSETKRRIDTARDILVGKVPDPKSQVEQITIALIYKFMDDMDAEAEELGGTSDFFAGEYERFGWRKIFDPALGGFEMLSLYGEAITRMATNPNLPQLFRDIFKNAYLPYRDPETLKSFLKIINDFSYDHSERLGDAFEYLLSVLGSQGDAGQFRTPRHIIDFMVAVVDPQKHESLLDPACGTAGFLIAAFKHIVKRNSANFDPKHDKALFEMHGVSIDELALSNGKKFSGDLLNPDERARLIENIRGFDISPDMVRLSLVNLYLHGFTEPHIFEYDTLTSEDRWNEYYDIVLANPPFMSPKGGIRPHKRFGVDSNRSEVLFVDYIAEHLTPGGRAAVIVPEGIIFQSATAYKSLRRMLVESNYLVGVISLPAGVFNPYSGVKTSILWIDKNLARRTDKILFVKIAADGFDLGAQRRPGRQNDLPEAFRQIQKYKKAVEAGTDFDASELANISVVEKARLAESGEWNLSGERYQEILAGTTSKYPMVELGELAEFVNGFPFKPEDWHGEGKKIIRIQNLTGSGKEINRTMRDDVPLKYLVKKGDLLISWSATIGFFFWEDEEDAFLNQHIFKVVPQKRINLKYLYFLGQKISEEILKSVHGNTMQHITKGRFNSIQIPLPPLAEQEAIVSEISGYQKIVDGARQVVENYRPRIEVDAGWEWVALGEAPLEIIDGDRGVNYPNGDDFSSEGFCLFLNTKNVRQNGFNFEERMFITKEKDDLLRKGKLMRGDILLTTRGTIGNTAIYSKDVAFDHIRINSGMLIFRPDPKLLESKFLYYFFHTEITQTQFKTISSGSAQPQLPIRDLKNLKIPLPPLPIQHRIVAEIEREQGLVASSRELIGVFEEKIRGRVARIWGG